MALVCRVVFCLVSGALLGGPLAVFGEALELPRLQGEVEIDGWVNEEAWQRITPLQMTQLKPLAGGRPSERTEIRIAYDDVYLYASGKFFDEEAEKIRGNSLQRDNSEGDDLFALILDSFNDNQSALAFYTNPAGTRIDETIANDAENGNGWPFNSSWNTFWDSASRRTDEGWFTEIRIPFSSLRFQSEGERVEMGLIAWRYIARRAETSTWPRIDPSWNRGHKKPSAAADVVLRGVASQAPLQITPYLLAGSGQRNEVNEDETAHRDTETEFQEVGFDLKYSLTSNLTLDLTWNMDFAQVEADDAQVNLSRFSLFQAEKRQFFQERSGLFEFNTGQQSRLFYSRRIGLGQDGNSVPILGGVRLVGRLGKWDLGFFDIQTEGVEALDDGFLATEGTPAENFGALRLRREILNDRSYVGGMLTSRLGEDGGRNLAYGLDTLLRFRENDEFTLRWAQTFDVDGESGEETSGIESGRLFAQYERRTQEGYGFTVLGAWSGADYAPDLGFAARTDFTRFYHEVRHSRLGQEGDRFRRRAWWAGGNGFWKNSEGMLESADWGFGANRETLQGGWIWVGARVFYENLVEGFDLGNVEIPDGAHTFFTVNSGLNSPPGRDFRSRFRLRLGTFYDGTRWGLSWHPTWVVSRHLEVGANYDYDALRFDDRGEDLDIHLVRLRVRYAFDNRLSVDLFSQYSSLAERLGHNLRLRYNLKEGNDLYLVINEGQRTDRLLGDLALPVRESRTVLLKYTHAMIF